MRRARFQHVAVGDGLDVVDGSRRDPERFTRREPLILQLVTSLQLHPVLHLPIEQVDCLVLEVVVLPGERLSRLHVQNFTDVKVVGGPDGLVAPWLGESTYRCATAHGVGAREASIFCNGTATT